VIQFRAAAMTTTTTVSNSLSNVEKHANVQFEPEDDEFPETESVRSPKVLKVAHVRVAITFECCFTGLVLEKSVALYEKSQGRNKYSSGVPKQEKTPMSRLPVA
jgi:hypothetical protein